MARTGRWAAAAMLLLSGCRPDAPERVEAPAAPASGEIAIEWAGHNQAALLVPVHINGTGPHSFVLDTGATLTCVDQALAAELALPERGGRVGMGAGVGLAGRVRLVQVESVRVGDARAEDLTACVLDLSVAEQVGIEIDGLIGLNFLRPFHLGLDFQRGVLTLRRP